MADHLQYQGADIETYTPHGEWLAELLHLAERRELRELIFATLGQFLRTRNELLRDLTTYEAQLDEDPDAKERSAIQVAIQESTEELARVSRYIELITGEPVAAERGG